MLLEIKSIISFQIYETVFKSLYRSTFDRPIGRTSTDTSLKCFMLLDDFEPISRSFDKSPGIWW